MKFNFKKNKKKDFGKFFSSKYIEPYGITANQLSGLSSLSVDQWRKVINGSLKINLPIALELKDIFGKNWEYWILLQKRFDKKA